MKIYGGFWEIHVCLNIADPSEAKVVPSMDQFDGRLIWYQKGPIEIRERIVLPFD